jgi:hypothetical protein
MTLNALFTNLGADVDYNPNGVAVMDEDWDTLIILDSCRYDTLAERHSLPGELDYRISRGGGTVEFLRGNFRNKRFHDTVYVTANPQLIRLKDELNVEFHDVVNVWRDHWDETIQNVAPDVMTEVSLDVIEQYPNKRIILHYNQPHGPFLGPTAEDLVIGPTRKQDESFLDFVRQQVRHDLLPASKWREAYIETFDIVHDHIAELLDEISGKTVVTSDHGQMLGERGSPIPIRYCGHRIGVYQETMVKVPWLVYESGTRRDTVSERPTREDQLEGDATAVSDRLRDLGYVGD